eukprot:m.106897 g.106897  ORF g.106897 m.106897 type:complete len:595 (-) comp12726_c0_seq2:229-2013(-)
MIDPWVRTAVTLHFAVMVALWAGACEAAKPNLVFIMADDLGSNDVGWSDPTVKSPEIDSLAKSGIILTTCYTWNWCAPSRGAMLSGRYPPVTGFQGAGVPSKAGQLLSVFPLEFPLLPSVLKQANYTTVMVGKYHLGFARQGDLPEERGFDRFLGYFTGGEDYYSHTASGAPGCNKAKDFWFAPAPGQGRPAANEDLYFSGRYSTEIFSTFAINEIERADASAPLFLYAAFQGVHFPLEVPKQYFERYGDQGADQGDCLWSAQANTTEGFPNGFVCGPNPTFPNLSPNRLDCNCNRLLVKAQVSALSEAVGNITTALQVHGRWESTVLVFMGDNGGPIDGAHDNAPLRGGKLNFFEGGIRPAAFVASPLLPKRSSQARYTGIIHETDWFATFIGLAGVDAPTTGLDGMDLWPTLTNLSRAYRTSVLIADNILRVGRWKIVIGGARANSVESSWKIGFLKGCTLGSGGGWGLPPTNNSNMCPSDIYTSGSSRAKLSCPNDENKTDYVVTSAVDLWLCSAPCTPTSPCLWDLEADPYERQEVASRNPVVTAQLLQQLVSLQRTFRNATTIQDNGQFCASLKNRTTKVGSFLGPWLT